MAQSNVRVLDLFAGTGWGVAAQWLGIEEYGVEIMPEAIATREANGMTTVFHDVWDGLENPEIVPEHDGLVASPPCQTYSMAGSGSGRKALDEVLEAIELHAYKDPQLLRDFGERHDPRTALVLAPLAYAHVHRPEFIILEQVPPVLPVWEACADVLREWGYTAETAVLNAEQYGVPQTRKRAILVASRTGKAKLPTPTHSRYYSRDPKRLDPGVLPWVSMAEALGWTKPGVTFTQNNKQAHQAVRTLDQPAPTVTAGHDSGNRGFTDGDQFTVATPEEVAALQSYPVAAHKRQTAGRTEQFGPRPDRPTDSPAFTVVGHDGHPRGGFEWVEEDGSTRRLSTEEAAALQSYPASLRSNYGTSGDPEARGERAADQPAATITSKANRNKWDGERGMSPEEASALQSYPSGWGFTERPAVTVGNAVGRGLIGGSGAKDSVERAMECGQFIPSPHGDGSTYAEQTRITVEEAAALQSYPSYMAPAGTSSTMVDPRPVTEPAHTITGKETAEWGERSTRAPHAGARDPEASRMTPEEAAALQTYPAGVYVHPMTNGRRGIWPADEPAPTIRGVNRPMPATYQPHERDACDPAEAHPRLTEEEAAALQSYPTELRPEVDAWKWKDAPATTIAGDPRITAREHHYHGEQSKTSLRLTEEEAVQLQTFPPKPFVWCGTKTKKFLQIGNAVPPVLAHAILSALIND